VLLTTPAAPLVVAVTREGQRKLIARYDQSPMERLRVEEQPATMLSPNGPQKVREKVAQRLLPLDPPAKIYAGYGQGKVVCAGCDEHIEPGEVEYELHLAHSRRLSLHIECVRLLEAERQGTREA
jgi:hypothetical protein